MKAGIVSYGVYIPRYRIKVEEIAKVWGDNAKNIAESLMVYEKSVPDMDEDTATIAVEAARYAIKRGKINPARIGAVFTGSESHPYAVKPTSTIVAAATECASDCTNNGCFLTAADFEFACKASTAAIQACVGLVDSDIIDLGLAIGSVNQYSVYGWAYLSTVDWSAFDTLKLSDWTNDATKYSKHVDLDEVSFDCYFN